MNQRIKVYPVRKTNVEIIGNIWFNNGYLEVSKGVIFKGTTKNDETFNLKDVESRILMLNKKYITEGSINPNTKWLEVEFIEDYKTRFPSSISYIVSGGRENGWDFWVTSEGEKIDNFRKKIGTWSK